MGGTATFLTGTEALLAFCFPDVGADEGLFAARDLPAHTIVCLYGGHTMTEEEYVSKYE